MKFAKLLLIITIYLVLFPMAHGQENSEFPNGIERTWTSIHGTTFNGKLSVQNDENYGERGLRATAYQVFIKADDGRTTTINLRDGYQHQWYQLHPKDALWIRNALEWRTYGDDSRLPLNPAQFADPEMELSRNTLVPTQFEPLRQSSTSVQASIARFALWWDTEGYLPISRRGDLEEKYVDFTRGFERHFNTRSESNSDFEEVAKAMVDLFQKEYDQPLVLATKQIPYCSPETLAHYTQGRQATILGLTTFRDTRREYTWRAALLSATEAGRVELELYGNHIIGQLKEVDPQERLIDRPAGGAWEVEILNRDEIELRSINEEVRLFIDPYWRNDLWVFKPHLVTSKEHLSLEPPFIMPPPVGAVGDNPAMIEDESVTGFEIRTEAKPRQVIWKKPNQMPRPWTRRDGKSLTGEYGGFFNFKDRIITISTPQTDYPVAMNSLVEADHTYVAFAACDSGPYPVESGKLVYELRESKDKVVRIELTFRPGHAEAKITRSEKIDSETSSFLEKATKMITNLGAGFNVDYTTLTYQSGLVGGEGKIEAASLLRADPDTYLDCGHLEKSAPVIHLNLPSRLIDIKACSVLEASLPGYLYQTKMARLGAPEAALFWQLLAEHSDLRDQLAPFIYFFKMGGTTNLIPMDMIAQHENNKGEAIRLQLVEAEIGEFSNP